MHQNYRVRKRREHWCLNYRERSITMDVQIRKLHWCSHVSKSTTRVNGSWMVRDVENRTIKSTNQGKLCGHKSDGKLVHNGRVSYTMEESDSLVHNGRVRVFCSHTYERVKRYGKKSNVGGGHSHMEKTDVVITTAHGYGIWKRRTLHNVRTWKRRMLHNVRTWKRRMLHSARTMEKWM